MGQSRVSASLADWLVRVAAWPMNRAYATGQVREHRVREQANWARQLAVKINADAAWGTGGGSSFDRLALQS